MKEFVVDRTRTFQNGELREIVLSTIFDVALELACKEIANNMGYNTKDIEKMKEYYFEKAKEEIRERNEKNEKI